ncbi:ATP-binding protein [Noviherbaspirillum sp. 1P10PC]|uniref:sensor histidine kinase n=1 Tax=Noviherbaspirillum sp. 1P10PC TaxID=3132292 RepID=UPI00399F7A2A
MPVPLFFSLPGFPSRKHAWRWLLPVFLLLLFLFALLWLPWQAQHMESTERQEQLIADTLWVEQTVRFQLGRNEESLRLVASDMLAGYLEGRKWNDRLDALLRNSRELARVAWLDADGNQVKGTDDGSELTLAELPLASRQALEKARDTRTPQYGQPVRSSSGAMTLDYYVPLLRGSEYRGTLVATYSTASILDQLVPWWFAQDNEILLTDSDDTVLDRRASGGPGRNVYTHTRALDLPGVVLNLRTNSIKSAPRLLPNLLVGSVIVLSLGLLWSLAALWRDINRRLAAEGALRQQVSFRAAMENSLVTGLRARDLEGRVTYVNPAFCRMVGLPASDIIGRLPPMPYWAPEAMDEYHDRFSRVLAGSVTPRFETVFQRADGERFPVLVFEAPLLDDAGRQTGWMGSILDVSDLRRAENINRQQQEKLQASARLASMGEIASTLAHELNQPLAAISSYATGALNLLERAPAAGVDHGMLRSALEKASAQAQRAGQIIRSVHAFVRKRDPARMPIDVGQLLDGLLPLVELQARQFFVAIHINSAPGLPRVLGDGVMLEQVLLNLTRNGIESMQTVQPERRILRIQAALDQSASTPMIAISVTDQGHGIPDDVAERLFSPFFSTKSEGMGMGLNICRTVVEFHGGTLSHSHNPQGGTVFRFTLPVMTRAADAALPAQ